MAKPTTTPTWVSDANAALTAYVVAPTAGKIAAGWATAEKLPAQYLNWLFYWITEWITWLDENISQPVNAHLSAAAGTADGTGGGWVYASNFDGLAEPPRWASGATGGAELSFALPLRRGDRLLEVTAYVKGGTSTNLFFRVVKSTGAGGAGGSISIGDSNATAGSGDQTVYLIGLTETIADLEFITIGFIGGVAQSQRVYAVVYRYDRP